MKAGWQGAVGRLGNLTKLLRRQRRDSQCGIVSTGKALLPFSEEPTGRRSASIGLPPENFSNQLRRNRRRKTAAPPPHSEKLRRVD